MPGPDDKIDGAAPVLEVLPATTPTDSVPVAGPETAAPAQPDQATAQPAPAETVPPAAGAEPAPAQEHAPTLLDKFEDKEAAKAKPAEEEKPAGEAEPKV